MNVDKIPAIWFKLTAAVYLSGLLISLILTPSPFALGVGLGGGLILLNAWASARKLRRTGFTQRSGVTASVLGGFYLRLAALGICLYAIIKYLPVDPVGLVAGLSVVPAGLAVLSVLIYIANRRPEEA